MIKRCTGLADFVAQASLHPYGAEPTERWSLGITAAQVTRMATEGDPTLVPSLRPEMDRFRMDAAPKMQWSASLAGARVCVPAYLAGNPMSMRRRAPVGETKRVGIYVSPVGDVLCSAAQMMKRGCAVLGALEMLDASGVQVDLTLVMDTGGRDGATTFLVPLETRPMDLSTIGVAIAHPAFYRHLGFGLAKRLNGFTGRFSDAYRDSKAPDGDPRDIETYINVMRRTLDLSPSDIFIPRVTSEDPMVDDPAGWMMARVQQAMEAT